MLRIFVGLLALSPALVLAQEPPPMAPLPPGEPPAPVEEAPAPVAEPTPAPQVAPAGAPPAAEASPAPADSPAPTAEAPAVAASEPLASMPPAIERGGFYLGLGLGIGASGVADNSLFDSPLAGALNIRTGAAFMNQYAVGLQIALLGQFAAWEEKTTTGALLSSIMAEVMTFPIAYLPLNVAAGAGWGSAVKLQRIANTGDGDPKVTTASGNGISWLAAVGWDFYPGEGANLGVQLRYEGMSSSGLGVDHTASLGLWLNYY